MMEALIILLAAALGGFFYRCRGGFMALGSTTLARLVWWALPCGVANTMIVMSHGGSLSAATAFGFFTMLFTHVSLLEDQSSAIDNDKPIEDAAQMTQIMTMRAIAIALPVVAFAPWMIMLPLFGMACGPIWWACWRYLDGIDSRIEWRGQVFARGGSEWAEVFTGVCIGAGIGLLGFVL